MRFVNPDKVELRLPENWLEKVENAWAYVESAMDAARKEAEAKGKPVSQVEAHVCKARAKAINAKASVWADAGLAMRDVMYGKCWYCETLEIRSDMPIDHFRPKNSVFECDKNHNGYWWLAFDWKNFRFACTYCNSRRSSEGTAGGKQDHFPLLDPSKRAWSRDHDLLQESPELLDPCDPEDPDLLSFYEDGRAVEADHDPSKEKYKRAHTSISIYHLNHNRLRRERHVMAIKIRNYVDLGDRLLETKGSCVEFKEIAKAIIGLIEDDAPFCTAARSYLKRYEGKEWVARILWRNS